MNGNPTAYAFCPTCRKKGIVGAVVGGPTCQCHIDSPSVSPQLIPDSSMSRVPASGETTGGDNNEILTRQIDPLLLGQLKEMITDTSLNASEYESRFQLAGRNIFGSGIHSISGLEKAGKSSFIGAILASAMGAELGVTNLEHDYLGITSENPCGRTLLYFDTEQPLPEHKATIVRAARAVGLPNILPCIKPVSFYLGCKGPQHGIELINCAIEHFKLTNGIFAIIIDNLDDICQNSMDPEQSEQTIRTVEHFAKKSGAPVICTMHLNPTQDPKMQGHLGTKLSRKASTNLVIKKNRQGVSNVYAMVNRGAPIPPNEGAKFWFDERLDRHVTYSPAPTKEDRKTHTNAIPSAYPPKLTKTPRSKARKPSAKDIRDHAFRHILGNGRMPWSDLRDQLQNRTKKSARTMESWITKAGECGLIIKDSTDHYRLAEASSSS